MTKPRSLGAPSVRRFLHRIGRAKAGNIAILAAFLMPLFIGAAGMATDTVIWTLWKREVQRSADSAAIAGALTIQQDRYQAEKAARHDFTKSKAFKHLKASMIYENSPSDGPFASDLNAVRITIYKTTSLPFSNFFLQSPVLINAKATATLFGDQATCIFGLDPSASPAIAFSGSSILDVNCGVNSNSAASTSVSAGGASSVNAKVITAVGSIPASRGYSAQTKIKPFNPPQLDPLRDVPDPEPPTACHPKVFVHSGTVATLVPGCYEGLEVQGNATFSSGTYYIVGSGLVIGSQASVSGDEVTFVLTRRKPGESIPNVIINGGATLNLSAPKYGTYRHLLFYQDRKATAPNQPKNQITGNSMSKIVGNLYFPSTELLFTGNSGFNLGCFKMVARLINITGNAHIANECPVKDERFSMQKVKLVA